jgi:hypothetical protein
MQLLKYAALACTFLLCLPAVAFSQVVPAPKTIQRISLTQENLRQICTLTSSGKDTYYYLQAGALRNNKAKQRAKTAEILVTYLNPNGGGWKAEAKAAFEYAIGIWETHIHSSVPIRIEANWVALSEFTLGSAGPTQLIQAVSGEPRTLYPIALASAIDGVDYVAQSQGTSQEVNYDITVNMNSNWASWYFGTDAQTPEGLIDFVTVVLHELGHGLGFTGSVGVPEGQGSAQFYYSNPMIYDRFVIDGKGSNLLNKNIYKSPSTKLYNAVTGKQGGIYFSGLESISANKGDRVKLYSPSSWESGSSYSHVDQATFTNTVNALMRPQVDRAYAMHEMGPVLCGVFNDSGWPLGPGCESQLGAESELALDADDLNFGVTNVNKTVKKTFTLSNEASSPGTLVARVGISDGTLYSISVYDQIITLKPGESTDITVNYIPTFEGVAEGEIEIYHNASNAENPVAISLEGEALAAKKHFKLEQSFPNPFNPTTTIPYALAQTSAVQLDVFDALGRHIQTLVHDQQTAGRYAIPFRADGLASGMYIYRLVVDGESKTGKLLLVK